MSQWFSAPVLTGQHVRLEPLELHHAPGLLAATNPETYKFMLWTPDPWSVEGHEEWVRRRQADSVPFAVIDIKSGEVVGSTTYLDLIQAHRSLEIGYTFYGEKWRGTVVNPESKLLLLTYAFETLECVRVQLKCDHRNQRSRNGILKLGAKEEGVLRNHRILADGHLRETAFFSILPQEWPEVRERLVERIQTFSALSSQV